MKRRDPYRWLAPFYGGITRVVFGKVLLEAKEVHLGRIESYHQVLILGGGSGEVLEVLLKRNPKQHIIYWESSQKMMDLTRNRLKTYELENVEFRTDPYPSGAQAYSYDVVITNFFLDLFDDQELKEIGFRILSGLKEEGLWIFTDFKVDASQNWQSPMIRIMYYFFGITTGLKTRKLADFHGFFESGNLNRVARKEFFNGMVEAVVFKKQ